MDEIESGETLVSEGVEYVVLTVSYDSVKVRSHPHGIESLPKEIVSDEFVAKSA